MWKENAVHAHYSQRLEPLLDHVDLLKSLK